MSKWLIAIMGPTASGKTGLAITLAKHFHTEIISVDSRQFYREMSIGTAKPTPAQLAEVKHHFIDCLSVNEEYTAGHFRRDALNVLDELFQTHDVVIAAGGSTLYYRALLEGIDEFPSVTEEAKARIQHIQEREGLEGLQKALEKVDPEYFKVVDVQNSRRLVRALEVSFSSGKPYSFFLGRQENSSSFKVIKIGLDWERDELYTNINARCDEMLAEGLLDEVKSLYPYKQYNALHTVGYTEFFDYLEGKYSYEMAVMLFKQHTRNYAKRQLTWFRKEEDIEWFDPKNVEGILDYIEKERKTE
jgi:tRNA dimethylallyltransferase